MASDRRGMMGVLLSGGEVAGVRDSLCWTYRFRPRTFPCASTRTMGVGLTMEGTGGGAGRGVAEREGKPGGGRSGIK